MPNTEFLNYEQILDKFRRGAVKQETIPVEHEISLVLPTHRFGTPAYAGFASAALRRPGLPVTQGAPDRWFGLDAKNGTCLLFARTSIHSFAPSYLVFDTVEVTRTGMSFEEGRAARSELTEALNTLSPQFLSFEAGDPLERHKALEMLQKLVSRELWPRYNALVGDFFEWLGAP